MIYRNALIATMATGKPYGLIENGALVISADRIKWVGPEKELPDSKTQTSSATERAF